MSRTWQWGVVLVVVVSSACGAPAATDTGVEFETAPDEVLACGGDLGRQTVAVAPEEGAGFPDPLSAVADAQSTGVVPQGEAEVVDEQGNGVVRSDGVVVGGFVIADAGDGWNVTEATTCVE